jgi:hypothetical protein
MAEQLAFKHGNTIAAAFDSNGQLTVLGLVHQIVSANSRPGDLVFSHLQHNVAWINSTAHDFLLNGQVVSFVTPADLNLLNGLKIKHNNSIMAVLSAAGDLHLLGDIV